MRQPQVWATAANVAQYSGDEVAGYLCDSYHRVRVTAAVDLLAAHLGVGSRVADLGSGPGDVARLLADRGLRPIACDVVPDALAAARRSGLSVVRMDVGGFLPFGDGTLDGILAGEIIEHVYDPALLLRECCRVLRHGGMVVVTTPNLAMAQDRIRFLAGLSPRQVDPFHDYLYTHIRPFTYSLLVRGMRLAGLVPGPAASNYVVWHTRFGELRSRWLAGRWPALGGTLIVPAVRPLY